MASLHHNTIAIITCYTKTEFNLKDN